MKAARKQGAPPQRASGSPRDMPMSSISPVARQCHHQASRRATCAPHCSDTEQTDGGVWSLPHPMFPFVLPLPRPFFAAEPAACPGPPVAWQAGWRGH